MLSRPTVKHQLGPERQTSPGTRHPGLPGTGGQRPGSSLPASRTATRARSSASCPTTSASACSSASTRAAVGVHVKVHQPVHANVRNAPYSTAPGPPDSQPPSGQAAPPPAGRSGRAVHFHLYRPVHVRLYADSRRPACGCGHFRVIEVIRVGLVVVGDEGALAGARYRPAVLLQQGHGLLHGQAGGPKLPHQHSLRRQRVARLQPPGVDLLPQGLGDDLERQLDPAARRPAPAPRRH